MAFVTGEGTTMLQDRAAAVLTGLGIGGGLMYFLDPERGRRRRALVRDQIAHSANKGADAIGATGRDLAHRATGAAARVRGGREVVNALEEHKQAGNVPALQGGSVPPAPQPDIWQRQWAPTTRLLIGT